MTRVSILLLFVLAQLAPGQALIKGSYRIGQLPPTISVWRDQKLEITVNAHVQNAVLSAQFNVMPKGTTVFSAATGAFLYEPAEEDRTEFAVTFTATPAAGAPLAQTVFIKPLPFLRPEHDTLENRRSPPDESSGTYLKYTESSSAAPETFNHRSIITRSVEISGKTVVLEAGKKEYDLIHFVPPATRGDVKDLKIYAETVIVRSPLHLPAANVTIWAREIRFLDGANLPGHAHINTTPLDVGGDPGQFRNGGAGDKAGSVTLHVSKFVSVPETGAGGIRPTPRLPIKRFILVGGRGQRGGNGQPGTGGNDLRSRIAPNPYPAGSRTVEYDCHWLWGCSTSTVNWNAFPTNNTLYIDVIVRGEVKHVHGVAEFPTNGTDATAPGAPGRGGDGGDFASTLDLGPHVSSYGGYTGEYPPRADGGAAGLPTFSQFQYLRTGGSKPADVNYSRPGATRYAPSPSSYPTPGTVQVLTEPTYSWLHPFAARAILDYAKDSYRDGNLELTRSILADYRPILDQLAVRTGDWANDFSQARFETQQMLHRIEANLDYYGNPAGWVPLLSLEANMLLLQNEVNSAVPILYLSHWMESRAQNERENLAAINASKDKLWADLQAAQKAYTDASNTIPGLQADAAQIENEIASTQRLIAALEQRLLERAQRNVEERNRVPAWKTACRLLATACKVIPVYQPALMAIGTGLDFVTNIDPNKPLESFNEGMEIAKQFNSQLFAESRTQLQSELAKLDRNNSGSLQDYAKNVLSVYNKFSTGLDEFRKAVQSGGAPQSQIEAEVQKVRAEDPEFQTAAKVVSDLNARKAAYAHSLSTALDVLTKSSDTITSNAATIAELDRTLVKAIKVMDHRTVVHVRDMGRRAEERLQKYLYYMAKAYEYRMLQPYPGNLRIEGLVDEIKKMLTAEFTTDPTKFSLVLEPYRQALREVIARGISDMQAKTRPQELTSLFVLTPDELQTLNDKGQVTINLADKVTGFGDEEEKRITDFAIDGPTGIQVNQPTSPTQIVLRWEVTGNSVLTTTSGLDSSRKFAYSFRFGSPGYERPFTWRANYYPSLSRLQPIEESPANFALLRTFLARPDGTPLPYDNGDLSALFYARPSAESLITIARSSAGARITALRYSVKMSYVPSSGRYGVLQVDSPEDGVPLIDVSTVDETGRRDGQGTFRRVLPMGRPITLTAQMTQGNLRFKQWTDDEGTPISSSPALTLTINGKRTVKPTYVVNSTTTSGFQVSGTVTDAGGNCASGVTATLTGTASSNTVTSAGGSYSFSGLAAGNYTVTPSKPGCTFTPPSASFALSADRVLTPFAGSLTSGGPELTLISPANGSSGVVTNPSLLWTTVAGATAYDVYFGTGATPALASTVTTNSYAPPVLIGGVTYSWRVVARNSGGNLASSATWSFTVGTGTPTSGLFFTPVSPCRVADTRASAGKTGLFGPPHLGAAQTRTIPLPASGCPGIPGTAKAYSINVTVVPHSALGYVSLWPAGQSQPLVSTLNSPQGSVTSNAAIVPAGANGGVSIFTTNPTDLIVDVNGYFDSTPGATAYAFYPVAPCRASDTRLPAGMFGGPQLNGGNTRSTPIASGNCGVSPGVKAYSLNVTVVPDEPLGYLTMFPTGASQPLVSTLNSPAGRVQANAAIVPSGTNDSVSTFVTNRSHVILDLNGYFSAPNGTAGMKFYPVTPCRISDTRNSVGPFGGPVLAGGSARTVPVAASACGVPTTATAYSLNVTVVPKGPLGYLTIWPAGGTRPLVSTLNSPAGQITANAAIVRAGANGSVSLFATEETHVILDINGYFAP